MSLAGRDLTIGYSDRVVGRGLNVALERMGANHLDILPVVNRADIHQLEGTVTLRDVLNSYGINSED